MRAKRVPATASVTMTSHMCEDISYDTHLRTEMLYLHNDSVELSKKIPVKSVAEKSQSHVQGDVYAVAVAKLLKS